nr:sigma-70 family RNA polymerase sigma factor [Gammaproteobacteria bacterium]
SIEDNLISEEQKKQLIKALNSLNDEDKELIFLYFGIEGREEHSYSELANIYNKSDETIRQRILKILLKIKNNNGV